MPMNAKLKCLHRCLGWICSGLVLLFGLALPTSTRADLTSDCRTASGVIDNYLQGVSALIGNDVLSTPIQVAIDATKQALDTKTPAQLQFIADGTQFASIISDIVSLQGDVGAAAHGDVTKAGSLFKVGQDLWGAFCIIASKSGIIAEGGFMTAEGAANQVIGVQFFIVSQTLNLQLSVANDAIGVIAAGLSSYNYVLSLGAGSSYFSNTEKAMLNDYLYNVDQSVYRPLLDMLRSDLGIASYVPKTDYRVVDLTVNYPGFIFDDPRKWTIADDAKVVVVNGVKKLQIAAWAYTQEAGGKQLPTITLQYISKGQVQTLAPQNGMWGVQNGIAQNDNLYGPKCSYSLEIPLPNNTDFPDEVQINWHFSEASYIYQRSLYHFPHLQVQSPNLSGNFLNVSADGSRNVSIPVMLSSALAVQGITYSLTPLNTTNNPPIVATNLQYQFTGLPSSLSPGQPVAGSLDLVFPSDLPAGTYAGLLQIDAPNIAPISLCVRVTVPPAGITHTHTINTSSSPSEGGTTSGGGTKTDGDLVMVTASPNSGHSFVNWTEGGTAVSASPSYTFTVTGNRNLVANFSLSTCTINTSSSPSEGGTTSGGGTKTSGSSVTVTATPNSYYYFVNWTEGGTAVSTSPSYILTAVGDRNLVANFSRITRTINIGSSPPEGGTTGGGGTVNCGDSVTVTATPNSCYQFASWTEGGTVVSTSPSCNFVATSDRNLVANFTILLLYTTNNGTITITRYTGSGGDVTIPDTINGLPVTSIGDEAFSDFTSLTSVTIPASVTNLGSWAFHNCTSLTGVYFLGNAPSLGSFAFDGDNNATAYYPVETTGWGATFGGLWTAPSNLNYTTSNGAITIIPYNYFDFVDFGTAVTIPDTINGLPVICIGDNAFSFAGASITSVTIPNSVTSIGSNAFIWDSSLTSVTIPNSVTNIGNSAFYACASLNNVMIGNQVISIGDCAFGRCSNMTSVIIPNSVTSIGSGAFSNCFSLTNIIIGNRVTNIGSNAFAWCQSLTSVTIPNSVTNIKSDAFSFCSNLKGIYFKGNCPSVGSGVLSGANNATVYYLPGTTGWRAPFFGGRPAFLWNPQPQAGDGSFGIQANQFGFNITGSSNLVIVVEGSTNLANPVWSPLSTNTLNTFIGTNGTSYFSDPQWTNYPGRFYRLRSP